MREIVQGRNTSTLKQKQQDKKKANINSPQTGVDWTLTKNILNHFTEKLKFCDAFCIVSSVVTGVFVSYFLFCWLSPILHHFPAVKCHKPLHWLHGSSLCWEWNDKKLWRKLKYNFCCESPCCVIHWNNILAVLIFFISKHNIKELDDFFLSPWSINDEANYWWTLLVPMIILASFLVCRFF